MKRRNKSKTQFNRYQKENNAFIFQLGRKKKKKPKTFYSILK